VMGLRLVTAPDSPLTSTNVVEVGRAMTLYEVPGLLVLLWLSALLFKYLSEFLTRMMVQLWGFTVSLQPGSRIRAYVYKPATKVALIGWALLFTAPYLVLSFYGMRGLVAFLAPRFAFVVPMPAYLALAASYMAAFIMFPAMRTRIQDDHELLELLIWDEVRISHRLHVQMREKMVEVAAPHLSAALLADVKSRGPEALSEWTVLAPAYWERIRQNIGASQRLLEGVRQVRHHNMQGQNPGEPRLLAVQGRDGKQKIFDVDALPDEMREGGDE